MLRKDPVNNSDFCLISDTLESYKVGVPAFQPLMFVGDTLHQLSHLPRPLCIYWGGDLSQHMSNYVNSKRMAGES